MLHSMRKGAGGWLAKGLLLLLVASFGLWGIGSDMLGSSVGSNVIEVGEQTVSLGEFQREYRNRLNQVSNYLGRQITTEEAKRYGVTQSTITSIQTRLLEKERVRELDLGIPDDAVLNEIKTGEAFRNVAGNFDRLRFETLLRQNGYSEKEYIDILRGEMKRSQLIESITLPSAKAPDFVAEVLFKHYLEKRTASYVEILDSAVAAAPAPSDEELTKFVEDNAAAYTAPEYRQASFIYLTPETFAEGIEVTEDEIKAEYEGRASEFQIPEKRHILQMVFDTEDKALEATAQLSGGAAFAAVANDLLQMTASDIDLGLMTKNELLTELQEAAFNVPVSGVTVPVKTILGWHLIEVSEIEEGHTSSIDEVRDQLTKTIALRGAVDVLYEKSTALQDEFAGGASIQEAANALGLKMDTLIWTDQNGLDEAGTPVANLPAIPEFNISLFAIEQDDDLDLKEASNGTYYALALEDVKASALKDLASVRSDASTAWSANWQHEQNKQKAEDLLAKLKAGDSLSSLGMDVKTTAPGTRTGAIAGLSTDTVDELFSVKPGEFVYGENDAKNGYVILTPKEVVAADMVKDKKILDQLKTELGNGISQDLNAQYMSYLEKKIGFSVKTNLIEEYF